MVEMEGSTGHPILLRQVHWILTSTFHFRSRDWATSLHRSSAVRLDQVMSLFFAAESSNLQAQVG